MGITLSFAQERNKACVLQIFITASGTGTMWSIDSFLTNDDLLIWRLNLNPLWKKLSLRTEAYTL